MKSHPVRTELLHADGQTDRQWRYSLFAILRTHLKNHNRLPHKRNVMFVSHDGLVSFMFLKLSSREVAILLKMNYHTKFSKPPPLPTCLSTRKFTLSLYLCYCWWQPMKQEKHMYGVGSADVQFDLSIVKFVEAFKLWSDTHSLTHTHTLTAKHNSVFLISKENV